MIQQGISNRGKFYFISYKTCSRFLFISHPPVNLKKSPCHYFNIPVRRVYLAGFHPQMQKIHNPNWSILFLSIAPDKQETVINQTKELFYVMFHGAFKNIVIAQLLGKNNRFVYTGWLDLGKTSLGFFSTLHQIPVLG